MPASWTAADVMGSEVSLIPPETTVQTMWETSRRDGAPAFLIGTPERLVGMVNAQQLAAAVESGHLSDPVGSLLDHEIVHAHPDHPSEIVLERLAQTGGVLPIVSRDDTQRVLGVVTFPHIMQFMRKRQPRVQRHRSNSRGLGLRICLTSDQGYDRRTNGTEPYARFL